MYTLTLKTPPEVEPITAARAISYMKLDPLDAAEMIYLIGLIKTAREYCEGLQNRAYITQTWEMSLNRFDKNIIEIPKGSLQTINSVKYTNSDGNTITLAENTDYIVSTRGILGKISPPYGRTWPTVALYPLDPIIIEFTCGYGSNGDCVPMKVIQSMYMLMAYWWSNKEAADTSVPREIEFSVRDLLSADKIKNV